MQMVINGIKTKRNPHSVRFGQDMALLHDMSDIGAKSKIFVPCGTVKIDRSDSSIVSASMTVHEQEFDRFVKGDICGKQYISLQTVVDLFSITLMNMQINDVNSEDIFARLIADVLRFVTIADKQSIADLFDDSSALYLSQDHCIGEAAMASYTIPIDKRRSLDLDRTVFNAFYGKQDCSIIDLEYIFEGYDENAYAELESILNLYDAIKDVKPFGFNFQQLGLFSYGKNLPSSLFHNDIAKVVILVINRLAFLAGCRTDLIDILDTRSFWTAQCRILQKLFTRVTSVNHAERMKQSSIATEYISRFCLLAIYSGLTCGMQLYKAGDYGANIGALLKALEDEQQYAISRAFNRFALLPGDGYVIGNFVPTIIQYIDNFITPLLPLTAQKQMARTIMLFQQEIEDKQWNSHQGNSVSDFIQEWAHRLNVIGTSTLLAQYSVDEEKCKVYNDALQECFDNLYGNQSRSIAISQLFDFAILVDAALSCLDISFTTKSLRSVNDSQVIEHIISLNQRMQEHEDMQQNSVASIIDMLTSMQLQLEEQPNEIVDKEEIAGCSTALSLTGIKDYGAILIDSNILTELVVNGSQNQAQMVNKNGHRISVPIGVFAQPQEDNNLLGFGFKPGLVLVLGPTAAGKSVLARYIASKLVSNCAGIIFDGEPAYTNSLFEVTSKASISVWDSICSMAVCNSVVVIDSISNMLYGLQGKLGTLGSGGVDWYATRRCFLQLNTIAKELGVFIVGTVNTRSGDTAFIENAIGVSALVITRDAIQDSATYWLRQTQDDGAEQRVKGALSARDVSVFFEEEQTEAISRRNRSIPTYRQIAQYINSLQTKDGTDCDLIKLFSSSEWTKDAARSTRIPGNDRRINDGNLSQSLLPDLTSMEQEMVTIRMQGTKPIEDTDYRGYIESLKHFRDRNILGGQNRLVSKYEATLSESNQDENAIM